MKKFPRLIGVPGSSVTTLCGVSIGYFESFQTVDCSSLTLTTSLTTTKRRYTQN